jgi:hypothetical protein
MIWEEELRSYEVSAGFDFFNSDSSSFFSLGALFTLIMNFGE